MHRVRKSAPWRAGWDGHGCVIGVILTFLSGFIPSFRAALPM
jgi:hypothetical protein